MPFGYGQGLGNLGCGLRQGE